MKNGKTMRRLTTVITLSMLLTLPCFGATPPEQQQIPAAVVSSRIETVMAELRGDEDFGKAEEKLRGLLQQIAGGVPPFDVGVLTESAFALRLVRQIGAVTSSAERAELLTFLLANDTLARAMAFTVDSKSDDVGAAYALLARLRKTHGEKLNDYAYLAAALCVVHDKPLSRNVNENRVSAPDPIHIFDFYVVNARHMLFDPKKIPPELLIHVVDTTASIAEMKWALQRYRRKADVGRRFHDIKYDRNHVRLGTTKKVTELGYNLPNILQYGGVCADQAYFAVAVGKAIGVPTCYTVGRGSDAGHAWVGFFQAARGKGIWNFDSGRFGGYCVIRGVVRDPQTGRTVPSDYLSIQAELIGTKAADRYAAVACRDAARTLSAMEAKGDGLYVVEQLTPGAEDAPPETDTGHQLDLIEQGLNRACGYADGWLMVSELAQSGKMTLEQKKHWAQALQRMCGRKYPDFSVAVLKPMIQTVEDVTEQNALWESCFKLFSVRHDLAAEIRIAQGEMWDKAGEPMKAGKCYEDIIKRFINSGPFAVKALERTEEKLRELKREKMIPRLYTTAWGKCRKPNQMTPSLTMRSNWFIIGRKCVKVLGDFGYQNEARQVQSKLASIVGKENI